ncbi:TerS protein [Burkholderia thailandensis]|uniref:TerS protein n=1 Tax=Burkholderia thailandensis TaxID=57975 RepID=UPI000CAD891C|nr:TerS protein [Burkholderia thailandensis]MCS6490771.1 TerS protein [Burkholderia thailandensis]MCS6518147.1 TerS protein [Burkholderia thailandensis]PJO72420.1 TerS protein [Burkholderia thailandensis]
MKVAPRRKRSDSATAAIQAHQNAALGPLEPPAYVMLRDSDRPFWNAIMAARARDTWTEIDLAHAANLARCQSDVARLQAEIEREGDVIDGALNPKHKLVETLSRRAVALSRMLHVHAQATVGRSEDARDALKNEREAREDDDELIPTLRAVK